MLHVHTITTTTATSTSARKTTTSIITRAVFAQPKVVTTTTNSTKVRYLHIVISAARSSFKIESGEGECDPVVFWHTDDVNTAQSVEVVAGKVGGLYDARQ